MKQAPSYTPVILAGNSKNRMCIFGTKKTPQPFLRLFSEYSLFQTTALRASKFGNPVIVCHESFFELAQRQLEEVDVEPQAFILEPEGKGTAAAIALAAFYLKHHTERMIVMPSDHVFSAGRKFYDSINNLYEGTEDKIVLCGTRPRYAEKNYGYIITEDKGGAYRKVEQFIEKPDLKQAQQLIKNKNCLWNTGVLLASPTVFLESLKQRKIETYKCTQRSFYASEERGNVYRIAQEEFSAIRPVSVEHAITVNRARIFAMELSVFWSDVSSWSDLLRLKMESIFQKEKLISNGADETKKAS